MSAPATDPRSVDQRIVEAIIDDLSGRGGLADEWNLIDDDVQDELIKDWRAVVRKHLAALSPEPRDEVVQRGPNKIYWRGQTWLAESPWPTSPETKDGES